MSAGFVRWPERARSNSPSRRIGARPFGGMAPAHSRLSKQLQRMFRPRIESGFNTVKNTHRRKDFFLNSRHLTQILCLMSDVLSILDLLAQERPERGRETRKALLLEIEGP